MTKLLNVDWWVRCNYFINFTAIHWVIFWKQAKWQKSISTNRCYVEEFKHCMKYESSGGVHWLVHYADAHVQGRAEQGLVPKRIENVYAWASYQHVSFVCFIVNIPRPPSGRSTPVSGSPSMQRKEYRVQTSQSTGNKVTMNPADCSQAISRLCLTVN